MKPGDTHVEEFETAAGLPEAQGECPCCGRRHEEGDEGACEEGGTESGESPDPLIGVVLGNTYRITEPLNNGGTSRLYRAEHTRLSRLYTIKVTCDTLILHKESLERAEREALAINRTRSGHVVEVHDMLHMEDGRPCLVMDYLEGEDLRTRLEKRGKLPLTEAVDISRQLCLGIAIAHENGIVHRDIKPSNVFLAKQPDGAEVVKLLDFGVAKIHDGKELTESGALVGTPAYMAPEQAKGAHDVDARADIYAIGAVLFAMVTGKPPYGQDDATDALMGLLKGEPPNIQGAEDSIPEELEAVIVRAMSQDPEDRPATAKEFAQLLSRCVQPETDLSGNELGGSDSGDTPWDPSGQKFIARGSWPRTKTLVLVILAAVFTSAWAAAFMRSLLFSRYSPRDLPEEHQLAVIGGPALLGFLVLLLGGRAVVTRWRSERNVASYALALKDSMWWGLTFFALIELGLQVWRVFLLSERPIAGDEHALALGVAAIVALLTYLMRKWSCT